MLHIMNEDFLLRMFCVYVYSNKSSCQRHSILSPLHDCLVEKKIFWCVWNKPSLPQTLMKRKLVDITLWFCFLCIPFVNFCPPICRYPYHSSSQQYIDLPRCLFLNTHQKQLTIIHKMLQVYLFLETYISDSLGIVVWSINVYFKTVSMLSCV